MSTLTLILIFLAAALIIVLAMKFLYHLRVNFVRILAVIIVLFLLSSFVVIIAKDIPITKSEGITGFAVAYIDWVKQIAGNVGDITGQVVKQDWTP